MSEEPDEPEDRRAPADEVELIRDGQNLLVVGSNRGAVERFMGSAGLLERAKEITSRQFVPMLRSAAEITHTLADTVAESALWVKLTEESAEAIKEFGLTETEVPGVAYAMAGRPGDIKQWLKINTSAGAKLASPGLLSGVAGGLAQAASQAEAEQLRGLLVSLDAKIDKVLRGQRDAIIGPLNGVERHLRSAQTFLRVQGEVDAQEWDKITGAPQRIREIQSTSVEKLRGIAADMEQHKRVGQLSSHLPELRNQVELWVGAITRCFAALDDFAALELEHTAVIAPDRLDAKRQAIQEDRLEAITELSAGVAELMSQMTASADRAQANVLLHRTKSPRVLDMIDSSRGAIKKLYNALGLEIDWDSVTAPQWRDALLELEQWKNALAEGGAITWEKGKPALKGLAMAGALAVVTALVNGKGSGSSRGSSEA
ncbi:hypothetical protein [Microbacterium marinilacus]|uniref:Alpha-xenorhabdolysin family binary toxin subunit A n=1 Tax=Microbacterium marinilacus TaxID=415209 RepID=A0ABP7BNG3_9MICO|nr:hypothetical protein [Microbacterium marinilacus]MBY0688801.1 hypothetical protein [Microbacterium marinilacus]